MNKLNYKYQLKTFRWAFKGLSEFYRTEVKASLHTIAALVAIVFSVIFKIDLKNWIAIIFAIALVFVTELINTIVERIADTLPDEHDKTRGMLKDLASGAVLLASIAALVIGLIIFIPKIIEIWPL